MLINKIILSLKMFIRTVIVVWGWPVVSFVPVAFLAIVLRVGVYSFLGFLIGIPLGVWWIGYSSKKYLYSPIRCDVCGGKAVIYQNGRLDRIKCSDCGSDKSTKWSWRNSAK